MEPILPAMSEDSLLDAIDNQNKENSCDDSE